MQQHYNDAYTYADTDPGATTTAHDTAAPLELTTPEPIVCDAPPLWRLFAHACGAESDAWRLAYALDRIGHPMAAFAACHAAELRRLAECLNEHDRRQTPEPSDFPAVNPCWPSLPFA
jgi:hypothetical protein